MKNEGVNIAQLLVSRLNHEYVSPLTAISNALELIDDTDDEIIDLIRSSTELAIAEVQFNRIAFGSFGSDEELSSKKFETVLKERFSHQNFELKFIDMPETMLKSDGKILSLALLCMISGFVVPRMIILSHGSGIWRIRGNGECRGENAFREKDYWVDFNDATANEVQFPLFFQTIEALKFEAVRNLLPPDKIAMEIWKS